MYRESVQRIQWVSAAECRQQAPIKPVLGASPRLRRCEWSAVAQSSRFGASTVAEQDIPLAPLRPSTAAETASLRETASLTEA